MRVKIQLFKQYPSTFKNLRVTMNVEFKKIKYVEQKLKMLRYSFAFLRI